MKKTFLAFLLIAATTLLFGQSLPCISDYKVNNGGGSCADSLIDGQLQPPTGSVAVTFDSTVDPNNLAVIVSVTSLDSDKIVEGVVFGTGTLNSNGKVTYCYYVGPNNNNNLAGHNSQFRFNIAYRVNGILQPSCVEQIPVPITLSSFTATRNNNAVAIRWITASESNSLGFEIQRLIGTGKWQAVSFINTKAENGYSATETAYAFTDQNPAKGMTQYRIMQVDVDQRIRFSGIRAVRGIGQKTNIIVYPNPSSSGSKVNILFDEKDGARDIALVDMSGRVLRQWKGFTNDNLQIENLTPGIYNLKVTLRETGEQHTEKIVVNKN